MRPSPIYSVVAVLVAVLLLVATSLLASCGHPPQPLPEDVFLPPYCTANAKFLPPPHGDQRSVMAILAWARTAARAANAAIAERDQCAMSYAQIRAACSTSAGCIIKREPP